MSGKRPGQPDVGEASGAPTVARMEAGAGIDTRAGVSVRSRVAGACVECGELIRGGELTRTLVEGGACAPSCDEAAAARTAHASIRATSFGEGADLLESIVELIQSAQQRLWLGTMIFDARCIGGARVLSALERAHERGVDVRVILRPELACHAAIAHLSRRGIPHLSLTHTHFKEVLSDERVLIHSMNFTEAEINRNLNAGHLHEGEHAGGAFVAASAESFEQLWARERQEVVEEGEERHQPIARVLGGELVSILGETLVLNPLQSRAAPMVMSGNEHLLVSAPTGSGKSLVGQMAALRAIVLEKRRAIWVVPSRALASEIRISLRAWESSGIRSCLMLGGESPPVSAMSRAQMWVCTPEKLEALWRRADARALIAGAGCVVIDEIHQVGDPERGAVLESFLMRLIDLSAGTRLVGLSATIPNAEQLASWLGARTLISTWRPVQIHTEVIGVSESSRAGRIELTRTLLREHSGESALIFCGSRSEVREFATGLAGVSLSGSEEEQQRACNAQGVGFHHSGLSNGRSILAAFNAGKLDTLVATTGLTAGVNTPAEVVVIANTTLGRDTELTAGEATQMIGRAGRVLPGRQSVRATAYLLSSGASTHTWRERLARGSRVESALRRGVSEALLGEIHTGGVRSREEAALWWRRSLAGTSEPGSSTVELALERLMRAGLILERPAGADPKRAEPDSFANSCGGALVASAEGAMAARLMISTLAVEILAARLAPGLMQAVGSTPTLERRVVAALAAAGENERSSAIPGVAGAGVSGIEHPAQHALLELGWSTTSVVGLGRDAVVSAVALELALSEPSRLRAGVEINGVFIGGAELVERCERAVRVGAWHAGAGAGVGAGEITPLVALDVIQRVRGALSSNQALERGAGCAPMKLELDAEHVRVEESEDGLVLRVAPQSAGVERGSCELIVELAAGERTQRVAVSRWTQNEIVVLIPAGMGPGPVRLSALARSSSQWSTTTWTGEIDQLNRARIEAAKAAVVAHRAGASPVVLTGTAMMLPALRLRLAVEAEAHREGAAQAARSVWEGRSVSAGLLLLETVADELGEGAAERLVLAAALGELAGHSLALGLAGDGARELTHTQAAREGWSNGKRIQIEGETTRASSLGELARKLAASAPGEHEREREHSTNPWEQARAWQAPWLEAESSEESEPGPARSGRRGREDPVAAAVARIMAESTPTQTQPQGRASGSEQRAGVSAIAAITRGKGRNREIIEVGVISPGGERTWQVGTSSARARMLEELIEALGERVVGHNAGSLRAALSAAASPAQQEALDAKEWVCTLGMARATGMVRGGLSLGEILTARGRRSSSATGTLALAADTLAAAEALGMDLGARAERPS